MPFFLQVCPASIFRFPPTEHGRFFFPSLFFPETEDNSEEAELYLKRCPGDEERFSFFN